MALPLAAIAPSLVAGGASLLGGLLGNSAKRKEAAKDRAFQLQMAQNAHQYEVADLRAAGLNPILSGTGGPGAKASGGSRADQSDPISPAVNSALAAAKNRAELKLLEEQAYAQEKQGDLANSQANLNQIEWNNRTKTQDAVVQQVQGQANLTDEQIKKVQAETKQINESARELGSRILLQAEQAKLAGNDARLRKVQADIEEWMQKNGMQDIARSIGLGGDAIGLLRAIMMLIRR